MIMQKEFGPLFDQKEAELRKLKRQQEGLENWLRHPSLFDAPKQYSLFS